MGVEVGAHRESKCRAEAMIDKHALRVWRGRIRDILNSIWDPIGGCPDDEYDGYVGKLAGMLRAGTGDDEMLAYLEWAEVKHMGLGEPFDRDRGIRVIKALRDLGPAP
jgi:hypothetical protein